MKTKNTTKNDKNNVQDFEQLKKTLQKRNFYTTKDSGMVYLLALLLPLAVGLLFAYISMTIVQAFGKTFENSSDLVDYLGTCIWYIIPAVLLTEIVFGCLYFCYNKANRIQQKSCNISFKKANVWTVLLSIFVGIVCVLGFFCLIEGCFGAMFDAMGIKDGSSVSLPLDNGWWYVANLVLLGVLPAICEELIFRGIVFQGLKEKFSPTVSVFLSGLLFALIHQNIIQFIYPFILGCLLAFVFEKTNNLLYSILIHMFNNFTTITLSFLQNVGAINLTLQMSWWFVLVAIALACVTTVILWLIYRFYLKKQTKLVVEKEGENNQTAYTSVGKFPLTLICGVVLAILVIVINCV